MSDRKFQFGAEARKLWPFEAGLTYLNHGTVGATPLPVLQAQNEIRLQIERHPARAMLRELGSRLRQNAERLAEFLGGDGGDYVFVDNASTGINAVLRSLEFQAGDEIILSPHTYGAVKKASQFIAAKYGAKIVEAEIPFPCNGPGAVLAALEQALSDKTKLVVLDHITSETALVLPIKQMVERCHAAGVRVCVDGAHVPGQIPLDIPDIGADWYVGNLHKWLYVPRAAGILWSRGEAARLIHPTVISWGYGDGMTAEFDWTGTKDPSAILSLPAALDFIDAIGWQRLHQHNHELVLNGGIIVASLSGRALGAAAEMTGAMLLVPLPEAFTGSAETAKSLRDDLFEMENIEVPIIAWNDRLWARLCAQAYNSLEDFELLRRALENRLGAYGENKGQ